MHVGACVIAGLTTAGRLLQHFSGTVFIRAAASVDVDAFPIIIKLKVKNL